MERLAAETRVVGDWLAGGLWRVVVLWTVVLCTGTVLSALAQSKPILCIPIEQSVCLELSGSLKVTDLAPPHCVFWIVDPAEAQEAVCLQTEPSAIP